MGAENSVLEGCDWGDKLVCPNVVPWSIIPVTKKDGMEGVVFQPKNSDKKENNLLQKSSKILKSLRHPNIVRYLGCGTSSDGFWLATETVAPLLAVVNDVGLTSHELVAGIWDILQALDFLHSKLGVCHNNLCPASVYVSKDGSWKLSGMEHACKFLEATPEFLESTRSFRNEDSLAPEEKTGTVKLDMTTAHARDVFALGALVDSLTDFVRDKNDNMIQDLEKQLTPCVSSDPSSRPSTSTLINASVFRSDFIEIVAFVKNVMVKTEEQKSKFFSSLLPKLHHLPEEVVARKLVLPLLSRFVLLDETAEREVLPSLLTPYKDESRKSELSGLLSETLFQIHIIPHLCNVFRVHDCHIRLVLLTHFHRYVHLFSREQLEEDIFLQILLGIRDTDDRLVSDSLRALADLVPLLGGDFVIGGSRKCFFFHGIPKPVSPEDIQNLAASTPNVTSVLTSARTPTIGDPNYKPLVKDPNYKPLLKDLAYGGKMGNHSSMASSSKEKERKIKEREQRREEARMKREERRLKAKTKHLGDETAIGNKDDVTDKMSSLTIEKVAALDMADKNMVSRMEDEGKFVGEPGEKFKGEGLLGQKENDDVDENEEEKPDWSDWEDPDGNISDDIEEELRNMPGESFTDIDGDEKVQTSPSPYQSDTLDRYPPTSPVIVDWSDTANVNTNSNCHHAVGMKGPLSLGGKRNTNVIPTSDPNENNDNVNGSLDSFDSTSSTLGAKTLKLKNTSSPSLSSSTRPNKSKLSTKSISKTKNNSDDLGLGYDIKSIEIKSKGVSHVDDLFADMTPIISSATNADPVKDLLDNLGYDGSKNSSSSKLKLMEDNATPSQSVMSNSAMFAVDTTSHGDQETGWGDDDDGWGNNDF